MNPFYTAAAVMGGRSLEEVRQCKSASEVSTSIAIGLLSMLSAAIILAGQTLFWQNIPSTAAYGFLIAVVLCVIYTTFYRVLIRASEVMSFAGKCFVFLCGGCMVGVNASLAGHELVLLPFAPQVVEMVALNASHNVSDLRSRVESANGLGSLGSELTTYSDEVRAARQQLDTTPEAVRRLEAGASACESQANALRQRLPADPQSEAYAEPYERWRALQARCRSLRQQATAALNQHRSSAQTGLTQAQQHKSTAEQALSTARQATEKTMTQTAQALQSAAASGFARHAALWDAVRADKVPAWAAVGLISIALILEGAGFFLKFLLPADSVSQERANTARAIELEGAAETAFLREMKKQIKPSMRTNINQARNDLDNLFNKVLWPSLKTRFAASQFSKAYRSTRAAQTETGQPAAPVVQNLAEVLDGLTKATHNQHHK